MEFSVAWVFSTLFWLQACLVTAIPQQHASTTDLTTLPKVQKVRTFILTDILNEPDDSMSLVRYLLYSNEFDTRGIVAVTSWSLRNETHPEEIKRIINTYGKVVDKLNKHVHPDNSYPNPQDLIDTVSSGPVVSLSFLKACKDLTMLVLRKSCSQTAT
jgi:hypothetical protein